MSQTEPRLQPLVSVPSERRVPLVQTGMVTMGQTVSGGTHVHRSVQLKPLMTAFHEPEQEVVGCGNDWHWGLGGAGGDGGATGM